MSADGPVDLDDPRLLSLRDQLGETLWAGRVQRAREREQLLRDVAEQLDRGAILDEVAHSRNVRPTTLRAWQTRYARAGLAGLIERYGRVARNEDADLTRAPKQTPGAHGRPVGFIKWAGSKASVMSFIRDAVPASFGAYFEPFVGTGIVFHSLEPAGRVVLGDLNSELITTYQVIRDDVETLIEVLGRHVNSYEHFIRIRGLDPAQLPPIESAARFIFLNKTCYNGLYRVNSRGHFNVPYGRIGHAKVCDQVALRHWSARLQSAELRAADYQEMLSEAKAGDLVYLDPPYLTPKESKGPMRYQIERFGIREHHQLAEVFRQLDRRSCHVIASNANLPETRDLYAGYRIEVLGVRRPVHFDSSARAKHTELLISNTRPRLPPQQLLLEPANDSEP